MSIPHWPSAHLSLPILEGTTPLLVSGKMWENVLKKIWSHFRVHKKGWCLFRISSESDQCFCFTLITPNFFLHSSIDEEPMWASWMNANCAQSMSFCSFKQNGIFSGSGTAFGSGFGTQNEVSVNSGVNNQLVNATPSIIKHTPLWAILYTVWSSAKLWPKMRGSLGS